MNRNKIVQVIIFSFLLANFGCAVIKFNAYAKNSGELPVSLENRDATVVVIVKDLIKVDASTDTETIIEILEKKFDGKISIDGLQIFFDGENIILIASAHGSGVIISKEGLILTNWHVVSKKDDGHDWPFICVAKEMDVACAPALVVAKDKDYDLAVIRTDELKIKKTVKLGIDRKFYKPGRIIYNWGFPIWYEKTLGYGYLSTSPSPEKFFGAGDRLLAQLPDGPGTSGSGIFDEKTHLLIGLMQGSANYNHFVIRYLIPSVYIKKFLDKNKIQ